MPPTRKPVAAVKSKSMGATESKKPKSEESLVAPQEIPPISEHVVRLLTSTPPRWVQVHFKLLTSSFLDDVFRLPATANLFMVETQIIAHHGGGITKLMLWKDDVQPKNILRDFSKTLQEVWNLDDENPATVAYPNLPSVTGPLADLISDGLAGLDCGGYHSATGGSSADNRFLATTMSHLDDHKVVLCYDYKPHDSECPLLLRSPRYSVMGYPPK